MRQRCQKGSSGRTRWLTLAISAGQIQGRRDGRGRGDARFTGRRHGGPIRSWSWRRRVGEADAAARRPVRERGSRSRAEPARSSSQSDEPGRVRRLPPRRGRRRSRVMRARRQRDHGGGAGVRVDPGNGAVYGGHPHGAGADGDRGGATADRDCVVEPAKVGVDSPYAVSALVGHPCRPRADCDRIGVLRSWNCGRNGRQLAGVEMVDPGRACDPQPMRVGRQQRPDAAAVRRSWHMLNDLVHCRIHRPIVPPLLMTYTCPAPNDTPTTCR